MAVNLAELMERYRAGFGYSEAGEQDSFNERLCRAGEMIRIFF